jgi:glycosyltransferase involved in cell wall biosynthesis
VSGVDLSVCIPVFQNTATLDELCERLGRVLDALPFSWEVVFVDDGSRDGSLALLEARAARDPRLRVFALTRNFGGQAALCAAFDQVRGKRTVILDADLENLPEDIPALLEPLERGHDLVCGVREGRQQASWTRRLPSALLNAYVRRQTGTRVRDIGCAMRAMDSSLVRGLEAEGEHRRLLTPLLLRRARSVVEVPIRYRPKAVPGGHTLLSLLGIAMDYYLLTARRPFLVSGLVAAAAALAGALALVAGAGAGGLVTLAAGLVGGLLSVVGEYVQRLYQLGQGLPFYQLREPEEPAAGGAALPSDVRTPSGSERAGSGPR